MITSILVMPFFLLAVLGFGLSVVAHACAVFGLPQPLGSAVMSLHGGVFVIWIPAILVSNRMVAGYPRKDFWKVALRGCPVWMRWGTMVVFAYAIINFVFFVGHDVSRQQKKPAGAAPPDVVRGFSGHWMAFYAAGTSLLYSGMVVARHDPARRCKNGHVVSPSSNFCDTCGADLVKEV